MNKRITASIMTRLGWGALFLVLLFLVVQVMPRALGQRELSDKSSDAQAPSVIQPSISSPLVVAPGVCTGYVIGQIVGAIVPGTFDRGNHCDNCDTPISLPFAFTLYDRTFNSVKVSSNGRLDFVTDNEQAPINRCLPAPPHNGPYDYTIFPYWDDLKTQNVWSGCSQYGGGCGIFTSVSGAAPNRIFNIEFRAVYSNNTSQIAHFEVRLYEGQARFDVIYGTVNRGNTFATAGVQRSDTNFTQYFCNGSGSAATGAQRYVLLTTASAYDFNHDGKPDYVLYNGGTRQTAVWYMNNNVRAGGASGPTLPAGWRLVDVADFNGDGNLDYALFNASTRQTAIWYLSGPTFIGSAFGPNIPSGWDLVATADFNFNCKPDYLLYNGSMRQTLVYFLNNNVYVSSAFGPTLSAGWRLAGVADFNRNGQSDFLLFKPATRQSVIWYLSGISFAGAAFGPTAASGYELTGTADFNGDGKPDYVLYNPSNRRTALYYLDNNVFISSAAGPILPAGWNLVAP
jgi:uncharacterized protein YbdZ (MbtH family)